MTSQAHARSGSGFSCVGAPRPSCVWRAAVAHGVGSDEGWVGIDVGGKWMLVVGGAYWLGMTVFTPVVHMR